MKKLNRNFIAVKTVQMITVLEGDGTKEFPFQNVRYIIDNDDMVLGTVEQITL